MEKVIKTRLTKGGAVHATKLVIDFSDVTREALEDLAARSIVISIQAIYRTAEKVPSEDVVYVAEFLARERASSTPTPEGLRNRFLKLPEEEKARALALLRAEVEKA